MFTKFWSTVHRYLLRRVLQMLNDYVIVFQELH